MKNYNKSANQLIDAFDAINACITEDAIWDCSHNLIAALGANHIVNSRILDEDSSIVWFRTSMHDTWIEEYLGNGYLYGDTILKQLMGSSGSVILEAGTLKHNETNDDVEVDFNRGLKDAGYGVLLSHSFCSPSDSSTGFVTICFDACNSNLKNIDLDRIKTTQSLLSIFLDKKPNLNSPGLVKTGVYGLSPRERDVLALLAHGNQTNRIAERLNISDVMVSKHFANARKKLGASTREQALALAMAGGVISL